MSSRAASWLAWSVCALSLSILAVVPVVIVLGWSAPLPQGVTPWRDQVVSLVGIIGAPVLGALIASRRPENSYGWLWLGFGLGLALQLLGESYAAYAFSAEPGSLPAPRTISRLLGLGGPLALTSSPFLLLLFLTGYLPPRRWRPVAWAAAVSGAALMCLNLSFASPEKVGGTITTMTVAVVFVIFTAIILSALSLVVRYRRAGGVERGQLKWFALAAVLIASALAGELLGFDRLLGETLWNLLDAATTTALYLGVGVAILKHRLYDIDIIINRTLVYGSLMISLAAVYFVGVVELQWLFTPLMGESNGLATVASTLAIAALFSPLRRRVRAFVDRRFYRRKYDATKTLEAFASRLREETGLNTLTDDMTSVMRETMQPAHLSLWLRPDPEPEAESAPLRQFGHVE